ncbi:phage head spike fiber domain-containing protein, partial [Limosilactobacillus reuteri]
MEKTIKYLENGEYHYATVRSVGDLAQLKTDSKETLVEAINELWNGGGNADPSKAPKPEGYDQLVQDVADAVKNQQEISQQWIEWQNEEAQLTEERKQAYLQAMKEMQEAIDKAKADAAALDDKTTKLDEQITKTFSDLDTSIQNMHEQLQKEADRMNQELIDTKSDLTKVRTDLQNAQLDNGRIHDELTNINGKFEHKVWQTDLDPLKAQIDRAETSVQQTKDELLGKASREDLDTVTNAVSKLDTQLKETAKGVEISVKKDELGGDVARLLNDKTNLLLGTRNFAGDKWSNLDHWHEEPGYWNGLKVYSSTSDWYGIQYQYEVKKGNQYTFSFYARQQSENNSAYIMLSEGSTGSQRACTEPYQKSDTHIGTEWKRYSLTFQAIADGTIYPRVEQSVTNNTIYVAGYKLELGKNATPWEPNEADIAENIEHTESQFNVYSDQIAGIVKKQEKMGDTERQLDTRITETAEGLKQTSKDLQDANGKITEFKGQLESTAHGLKTEYEKYTNDAIGQISDSTLNLIRNSSFQNKDEDFDQWQNISAKANVRSDENGLRWVELTQSGLTTNNPEGITSNYFNIKQGKVTVAVDIKSGDKASLDNDSVLSLELYNDVKKRVDFYDVSLSQLGLSKELLGDHKVHRGLYRLGIDRNDAKYMTVKAKLVKNGDLYFTNFSARLSSIDDGAYEPNPDDINQQILKQNTKIEQNAKEVAIKANSVDVTRDINDAVQNSNGGGVNLLKNSKGPFRPTGVATTSAADNYAIYSDSTIYMVQGQTYTVSGQTNGIWSGTHDPNTISDNCVLWLVNDQLSIIISANTMPHTFTWNHPTGVRKLRVNAYHKGDGNTIYAEKVKIERGTVATPWTPAPEDTSEEIKSAKDAAIQVASDQINLHVNEISTQFDDKLNKRINEQKTASEKFTSDGIEQVVTKVTNVKGDVDKVSNKLDNLRVGTSNLLHHSDTFDGWIKGYSVAITADKYLDGRIAILGGAGVDGGQLTTFLDGPYNDDLVTWVVYAKADNAGDKMHTELWGGGGYTDQSLTTKWQAYKFSGHRNINHPDFYLWGCVGNKGNIYVALPFAVIGNTIGSWSPNPGDIDQQIANTNKKIDTQTLDSANIDEMKTQGHYFVRNLTGNPIGGWVYVDVTGNNNDRIRQDVYADQNNQHKYRSWNGSRWSGWEQGAYISDVNNVKTEVTASVKNLGDRVTTQVDSIKTKVDNMKIGGRNLLKGTRDFNSKYWYQSGDHTALADNPIDTSTKEIHSWLDWHSFKNKQTIQLDPSKNYMISADIAIYDGDGNGLYVAPYGTVDGQGSNLAGTDVNLAGFPRQVKGEGFRRIYLPVTAHGRTLKDFRIEGHGNWSAGGGSVFISKIALYEGNTPLAWSDASDDFVEAIKEVNTKWDVANGQIQGKVTESQVNNILNGKGYATQSWAQTQFQMRSDAITLQAVRDNITNGIQNQLNSTNDRINDTNNRLNNLKIGGTNLLRGTSDTPRRLQGSGYLCKTTASDIYTSTADFHGDDQFTYSATITNNSNHPVSLEMWLFNGREKGHTASNINSHSEIVPAHTQNK